MSTNQDSLKNSNDIVAAFAEAHGYRTRRNPDGERVIPLRSRKGGDAHAGRYDGDRWYLIVLNHGSVSRALKALRRLAPGMEDRSGDGDLYVVVTAQEVIQLLRRGPHFARGRVQRRLTPEAHAKALAALARATVVRGVPEALPCVAESAPSAHDLDVVGPGVHHAVDRASGGPPGAAAGRRP